MSNKKIGLLDRKRLHDLQPEVGQTVADSRRKQIQLMQQTEIIPEGSLMLNIEKIISDAVFDLSALYRKWMLPINDNRYTLSPNECEKKLIKELERILNKIAKWFDSQGVDEETCHFKCQKIINRISDGLRYEEIPIKYLQLNFKPSRKR